MATPTAEKLEWYWAAKYLSADNDPLTLFATEVGSDRKNLIDSSLTQADDFFNGGIVRMVGGQNPGVYKRVRDFDQATNKITLDSDLPVLPDISDQFQLIIGGNFRSSSQVDGLDFSGLTMGGITINRVGYLNGSGAGTLTLIQASSELSWTTPGGVAGAPVDVSLDGTFTLFSTDQNKWITVTIVAASLPVANDSDTITLTRKNGLVIPDALGFETDAGTTRYYFLAIRNGDPSDSMVDARIFLTPDALGVLQIGLDEPGGSSEFENPADFNTAPGGVIFSAPVTFAGGLLVGDMAPGEIHGIWLEETIGAGQSAVAGVLDLIHAGWE